MSAIAALGKYPVVPLVGTWIEILSHINGERERHVVPLVGTWIEISGPNHPSWRNSRSPRGNVD